MIYRSSPPASVIRLRNTALGTRALSLHAYLIGVLTRADFDRLALLCRVGAARGAARTRAVGLLSRHLAPGLRDWEVRADILIPPAAHQRCRRAKSLLGSRSARSAERRPSGRRQRTSAHVRIRYRRPPPERQLSARELCARQVVPNRSLSLPMSFTNSRQQAA